MGYFRFGAVVLLSFFLCFFSHVYSGEKEDSLLLILKDSEFKSGIFNLLAEYVLEDSLDLSMYYAQQALQFSITEKNNHQHGIALFNIAEVYSYQYQLDSAVLHYQKALKLLKQTNDNYYISYALNNLGWINNSYGNYLEAIEIYKESILYLNVELHQDDLAHVYINIGNSYHHISHYETAINYYHKSVSIIKKLDDQSNLSIAFNGLGLAYKYLSKFDSAIYYYDTTLKLDIISGKLYAQAVDYGNIGALYFEWKLYDQSYNFHMLALKIYQKEGTKNDLSVAYNNLGEVHKALLQYDSSLYYLQKALLIDKETGKEQNMATRYHNIGEVFYDQKAYVDATINYKLSLEINNRIGSRYNIALSLKSLAQVNQRTGNVKRAEKLFLESLSIAQEINSRMLIVDILDAISLFYEDNGQYTKALEYHFIGDKINDSLFRERTEEILADLQTRHEISQKEKEISMLNAENERHIIEAREYRKSAIFFGSALLVISILLVFLILQYNLRKQAYKKLLQKNMELIESQKVLNGNGVKMITKSESNRNSDYSVSTHNELYDKFMQFMRKEKPYLNADLSAKEVAEKLKTNTHYLSEVINRNFGNNFTVLINEYRVKEACKLLIEKDKDNLTIESIAKEAGFNSKSAFNNAFKAVTGLTPSYYKKTARKK